MARIAQPLSPSAPEPTPADPLAAGGLATGSPAARFAFRFAAAYLVLYFFPAPLSELEWAQPLAEAYARLWRPLVLWAGRQVFAIDLAAFPSQSSDSHYAWVFAAVAALALHSAYGLYHARFAEPKPPLYGLWEVDRFALDGVERPPLWTDPLRWRRAVFGFETLYLHLGDDSLRSYRLMDERARGTLRLTSMGPEKRIESLSYRQPAPGRLELAGRWVGHAVRAELRRGREASSFPLNRGFRWIHEPAASR